MCDVERKSRECCRVCWSDEKVSIGRNEQKKNFQYPYSSCFCIVLVLIVLAAAESRVTEWPLFAIATDCRCRYGKREGEREKESFVSLLYSLYYLFFLPSRMCNAYTNSKCIDNDRRTGAAREREILCIYTIN